MKLGNSSLVQRAWRTEFKNEKAPSRSTLSNIISKLEKTVSLNDIPPFHTKPNEKLEEAKNQLKKLFSDDPSLSLRKAAVAVDISYRMTRNIVKNELHLKPYKYNDYHELMPQDYPKRIEFAKWF